MASGAARSAPPGEATAIDLAFLARQTADDSGLARELLSLFSARAAALAERLRGGHETSAARRDLVHTLKGSAKAIGASRVAEAAEECEAAPQDPDAQARLIAAAMEAIATAERLVAVSGEIG